MGIFADLRERRLFQIVFSYLAAGWIGLEVVDQLIQNQVFPSLTYKIALVWYLAGIPAALLVGWHHGEKGKQYAPLSEKVIIGALMFGVLLFTGMTLTDHVRYIRAVAAAEASALDLNRVAILYFDDHSPGGAFAHVADGLTEGLIDELSSVRALQVVSRSGVGPYRGEDVEPAQVGRALRAGVVVKGSIEQEEDQVRVNITLLEGETGAPFERVTFRRPAADPLAVQEELVNEVARLLRDQLGEEIQLKRTRRQATNPAAWVLFQRAETERKAAEEALRDHDAHAALDAFDRADALLDQAALVDAAWTAPALARGEIDYRRARISHDRHERVEWIEAGLAEAAGALALEPTSARALALRGSLRYFQFLQNLIPDPAEADALRQRARQDLERAVDLDPTLARAWSALQHLYITSESLPDAVMAGQRAYEEDAFLETAEEILWRLHGGHYDLGNFTKALEFCEEGARRFPHNDRFMSCQLQLMHTSALAPDPDRAWYLAARIKEAAADHRRDYAVIQSQLFVAGALNRAGLPDSARAVLRRAEAAASPEIDPDRELTYIAATVATMLGDDDRAIDLLKRHKAANPHAAYDHHWWWRTVRSHSRYPEIASADH